MATILLKKSSSPGAVPTPSQLELGELAINTADAQVYLKNTQGQVVPISINTSSLLSKSANLSDLLNPSTARTNLGLGSVATQNASSVAFTGGSIVNLSALSTTGDVTIGGKAWIGYGAGAEDTGIEIGSARTVAGLAYIDLISDTTFTDYGLRISRSAAGTALLFNRGNTSTMTLETGGNFDFKTSSVSRFNISATQIKGTTPLYFELGALGTNSGDTLTLATFTNTNTNQNYLKFFQRRSLAGNTSATATTRIQQTTDTTDQGYLEFNANGQNGELVIGTPTVQMGKFTSESGNTSTLSVPKLKVTSNLASSSSTNGALTVSGGVGVSGDLRAGGGLYAQSIYATNYLSFNNVAAVNASMISRPNLLLNGDFAINNDPKMGTSLTGLTYFNDVWLYDAGTGSFTSSIQSFNSTTLPTSLTAAFNCAPNKYVQINQSAVSSSAPYLAQRIEDARTLCKRKVGIQFKGQAPSFSTFIFVTLSYVFYSSGGSVETVIGQIATLSASWNSFSFTFNIGDLPAGFNYSDPNSYLEIRLKFNANATFVANLTHIKLENIGKATSETNYAAVTDFIPNPPGVEQAAINRYYQTAVCSARGYAPVAGAITETPIPFKNTMRAAPTATLIGTDNVRSNLASSYPTLTSLTPDGGRFAIASAAAGDCYAVNEKYILDARL